MPLGALALARRTHVPAGQAEDEVTRVEGQNNTSTTGLMALNVEQEIWENQVSVVRLRMALRGVDGWVLTGAGSEEYIFV